VHPRIAGRRDEVAREGRDRRRRIRWIGLGVAGLLTASAAVLFSPLFDMDHLLVSGVEGPPADAVSAAAGLPGGSALFGIDPAEVRERVEELDWVAHASAEVVWPDRVELEVTPQRPVALVAPGAGEPAAIAMATGSVFAFGDVEPLVPFTAGLPVLRLEEGVALDDIGSSGAAEALLALSSLGPVTAATVSEVTVDEAGRITFAAGPGGLEGAQLVIGEPVLLPEKAEALEAVLSGRVELACLSRLDVSVPSRVTIQRLEDCAIPDV